MSEGRQSNISDLVAGVRKRPGMFLGAPRCRHGVVHLVNELAANVIDLFLAGKARRLSVRRDDDGWVSVCDDGPGLPFDRDDSETGINMIEKHLTQGHQTATADGHWPHIHLNLRGIGMVVVGATAKRLEVESVRGGMRFSQSFERGVPQGPATSISDDGLSGSTFRFLPDPDIFGEFAHLDLGIMRAKLFTVAHLFPGLVIDIQDERFCAPGGLRDYVETLISAESDGYVDVVHFKGSTDLCQIEFACGGCRGVGGPTWIQSWANGIQTTEGGTHVDGMTQALAKAGLEPGVAAINVILEHPSFAAPTKARLCVREVEAEVEAALGHFLAERCT